MKKNVSAKSTKVIDPAQTSKSIVIKSPEHIKLIKKAVNKASKTISSAQTSELMRSTEYLTLINAGVSNKEAIIFAYMAQEKPEIVDDFNDALAEGKVSASDIVEKLLLEATSQKLLNSLKLDSPSEETICKIMEYARNGGAKKGYE